MKTISQAVLRGFVERDIPDLGAIEIAGLLVYLDKGAVVQANDFVQLDMTLDEHGLWRARIDLHLNNPLSAAAKALTTSVEAQPAAAPAVLPNPPAPAPAAPKQPAAPPTTVRSFTRHAQPTSTPAASASARAPAAAPAPVAATTATTSSRANRFSGRAQPQGPAARAPSPTPAAAPRPAFMDSAAIDDEDIPF